MQKIKYALLIILALASNTFAFGGGYEVVDREGYRFIIAEPEDVRIFTAGNGLTVNEFTRGNDSIAAAINGSFFDLDGDRENYFPVGLVISGGNLEWAPSIDVAEKKCPLRPTHFLVNKAKRENYWFYVFYVDENGGVGIMQVSDFAEKYLTGPDSMNIITAIETGPLILEDSAVAYNAFKERPSRNRKYRRSALGVTAGGKAMIFFTTSGMTFEMLAEAMRSEGAIHAVGLDGGSSCSFAMPGEKTRNVKVNTIIYVAKP